MEGRVLTDLIADLQRRGRDCRSLAAAAHDPTEVRRLTAKAGAYEHAAELAAQVDAAKEGA